MISEKTIKEANDNAHKNGWWDEVDLSKKLLLIVSEVCEAMEADRRGKNCIVAERDKTYILDNDIDESFFVRYYEEFFKHTFQEEIADIILRTVDLAYELNIDIQTHILLKHRYNLIKGKDISKKY